MSKKWLRPVGIYLLGVFSAMVVVLGIGVQESMRNKGADGGSSPMINFLVERVASHEKEAGLRCDDVHQGVLNLIAKDLSPLLSVYKTAGDWKVDLDEKARRLRRLSALAEACVALQRNLVRLGSNVSSPITQNVILEVSSLPVFVEGLASDACDPACVSIRMNLIEASRDALTKELRGRSGSE